MFYLHTLPWGGGLSFNFSLSLFCNEVHNSCAWLNVVLECLCLKQESLKLLSKYTFLEAEEWIPSWVGVFYKSGLSEIIQYPELSFPGVCGSPVPRSIFLGKKNVFTGRHSSNKHNQLASFACSLAVISSLVFSMPACICVIFSKSRMYSLGSTTFYASV